MTSSTSSPPAKRRPGPRRPGRNASVLLVLLLASASVAGAAQIVPVRPGQTIRVATRDSAALALWRTGRVIAATRIGVLLATSTPPAESLAVPLNESIRLQRQQRPRKPMFVGGAVGLVAGTVLGGTLLSSVFGESWGDEGPVAEMILFGLVGLGAGGVSSHLATRPQWVEVPITPRGLAPVALTRAPGRRASLTRTERWEWFEPTELQFAAFFHLWRDSLQALEGVWELRGPGSSRGSRMAVVRDARFQGYEFIGVRLPLSDAAARSPEDGVITLAIRRSETPGEFEIRYVGFDATPTRHYGHIQDAVFRIQLGGWTEDWIRRAYRAR